MTEEEMEYIIKETEEAIRLFKEYYHLKQLLNQNKFCKFELEFLNRIVSYHPWDEQQYFQGWLFLIKIINHISRWNLILIKMTSTG